jgi:pimeloyl-ACP methyl ester carboxylesterase
MNAPRGSRRYWLNLIGFTLVMIVVGYFAYVYLGVSYFMAKGFTQPKRLAVCCFTPADMGYAYEDVELTTQDGVTIRGWYIPSQNRAAVILIHPMASNRLGTMDHAQMFARHGYGALMIDLRVHGESGGDLLTFGGDEYLDVSAAVDYLQTRPDLDPQRIGVMGLSLGASAAVLSGARDSRLAAVAADAPGATVFKDWAQPESFGDALYVPFDLMFFFYLHRVDGVSNPLSITDAAAQISPRPLLLIGGMSGGSALEKRSVEQYFAAANEPKQKLILSNTPHIGGLSTHPQEYEETVIRFFDSWLLGEQ